jgi:DNA-binding beta-propeller fold protein YncE
VRRIDPRSRRVEAVTRVGRAPHGIAADGRGLWVAVTGDGAVIRIDPATARVGERVVVGGDPVAVVADGARTWVALNSDGRLVRLGSS